MQLQTTILVVLHKIIYDITCITNTELEMPPPQTSMQHVCKTVLIQCFIKNFFKIILYFVEVCVCVFYLHKFC